LRTSRYMWANMVYLLYSIGIVIINQGSQPWTHRCYIVLAVVHLCSAMLYAWAWQHRSWLDVVMVPEYLNQVGACLYLWSACWYGRVETRDGFYAWAVGRIELVCAVIDLVAALGW
jgi:hypothetical protein